MAITTKGTRCRFRALDGIELCSRHLGPAPPPGGRPTLLSDDVAEKIVNSVRAIGYLETAALAAGISLRTLKTWIERGDPDGVAEKDEPYRAFRVKLEQARSQAEVAAATLVLGAAQKDWRAGAWYLERTNPARWGGPQARNRVLGNAPDDEAVPLPVDGVGFVDDQVGPDGTPL